MLELKSQPHIVATSADKAQRGFEFLLSLPSQSERMDRSFPTLLVLPHLGSWKCFTVVVLWRGCSSVRVCTTLYKQKEKK